MSYWYIFWVLTGHERKVEKRMIDQLSEEDIIPFIPMSETLFKKAGIVKKELKIMFPGYLFIESNLKSKEFVQRTRQIIRTSKDIIRILKYGNSDEIAVREDERTALLRFCNDDHCIESSAGFIEGINFTLKAALWLGWKALLRKLTEKRWKHLLSWSLWEI